MFLFALSGSVLSVQRPKLLNIRQRLQSEKKLMMEGHKLASLKDKHTHINNEN
jgi:hypothetical protein